MLMSLFWSKFTQFKWDWSPGFAFQSCSSLLGRKRGILGLKIPILAHNFRICDLLDNSIGLFWLALLLPNVMPAFKLQTKQFFEKKFQKSPQFLLLPAYSVVLSLMSSSGPLTSSKTRWVGLSCVYVLCLSCGLSLSPFSKID